LRCAERRQAGAAGEVEIRQPDTKPSETIRQVSFVLDPSDELRCAVAHVRPGLFLLCEAEPGVMRYEVLGSFFAVSLWFQSRE
jgi:hypothetical protein